LVKETFRGYISKFASLPESRSRKRSSWGRLGPEGSGGTVPGEVVDVSRKSGVLLSEEKRFKRGGRGGKTKKVFIEKETSLENCEAASPDSPFY